ncbi:MAG: OmpA family protein [Bacteroidia bacterium]
MYRAILISIVFTMFQKEAYSQNIEFLRENFPAIEAEFNVALNAFNLGRKNILKDPVNYLQVKEQFEIAYRFNPSNAALCFNLGICLLELGEKDRAINLFIKARILDNEFKNTLNYYLGKGYHLNSQWDSALVYYNRYQLSLGKREAEGMEMVEKRKQECFNGILLSKDTKDVTILNLGDAINTALDEYTPFVSANEEKLFFTSRRIGALKKGREVNSGELFEDIYISTKTDSTWELAVEAGTPINTNSHDAVCGIFPDGHTLIVFKGDVNNGDLFFVRFEKGVWGSLMDFGSNVNTEDHESSACLSYDEKKLYFVSDKLGGFGGRDIYVSAFNDSTKSWDVAVNLGPEINSIYDEEGVFLHPDNKTLFFASNGPLSMGGYDILKSELKMDLWSKPVNLGIPINTPDEDVFVSVSGNGKSIYFSSTRPLGFGGKDIYVAMSDRGLLSPNLFLLSGEVTEEESGKPINATIDLIDLSTNQTIGVYKNDQKTGKYIIPLPGGKNYGTVTYADGYIFESENIDVSDSAKFKTVVQNKKLKKVENGSSGNLKNIFFEKGSSTLLKSSERELDNIAIFLLQNPSISIEINGHTDNLGDQQSNLLLSQRRGEEVSKELVKRKVSLSRLSCKGFGESQPISSNTTEEGRKTNRRIEFRIFIP